MTEGKPEPSERDKEMARQVRTYFTDDKWDSDDQACLEEDLAAHRVQTERETEERVRKECRRFEEDSLRAEIARLRAEWNAVVKALGEHAHPGLSPHECVENLSANLQALAVERDVARDGNLYFRRYLETAQRADRLDARIAELEETLARLDRMRAHCERCGGDYLATGVETGCPCGLRERIASLQCDLVDLDAALQMHADLNHGAALALGKPKEGPGSSWHDIPECITKLRARIADLETRECLSNDCVSRKTREQRAEEIAAARRDERRKAAEVVRPVIALYDDAPKTVPPEWWEAFDCLAAYLRQCEEGRDGE